MPETTATDRTPPAGYDWPGPDAKGTAYYLAAQQSYDGATPLFMVIKTEPGATRILAERCYRKDGVAIVDALRVAPQPAPQDDRTEWQVWHDGGWRCENSGHDTSRCVPTKHYDQRRD